MKRQRYAPVGALALNPKAFGLIFDLPDEGFPVQSSEDVVVVPIRGPLMHRRDFWFDSYDCIKERVAEAIASNPRAIILSIDSPGGLVSGAFDTSRELRKMAADADVSLYAHVDGQATSAAYALATAASVINVSQSANIGSIGVIDMLVDETARDAAMGMNVQLITSGARKADGNPHQPISSSAVEVAQARVSEVAEMFFSLVNDHGWGGGVDVIRGMEAGIVHGDTAVKMGLATAVATLDETIAIAASPDARVISGAGNKEKSMASPMEDALASLRKAAESEDEDEAKKAKAALKALGEGDDDDEPEAKAEGDDDDEPEAKAEGDDDDEPEAKAEGDDGEDAKAMAVAVKALAKVHRMEVEQKRVKVEAERAKLLASRPDFSEEMVKVLKRADMATVREMCKTLPKGTTRVDAVAAAATVTGTQGASDRSQSRLSKADKEKLDLRMGMTPMASGVVHTPNKIKFGVRAPASQEGMK